MRVSAAVLDALLVGAALLVIAVMLPQLVDFGYGRDQGIYAAVASVVGRGGAPYRDAWDFKPPGIFFVYAAAAAIGGVGVHAIRWVEAAALVLLIAAAARLSFIYVGTANAGILGGALAAVSYVQLEFWHTGQPESFGALFVVWGMAFAADAMRRARSASTPRGASGPLRALWTLWLASGACYGCAALLKPTIGIAGVASVAVGLWQTNRRAPADDVLRSSARIAIAAAVGALLPAACCLAFFAARGALPDLYDALFVFTPQYVAAAWTHAGTVPLLERMVRWWLFDYSVAGTVGLVLLFVPPPGGALRDGAVHIAAVLLALASGVFVQGRLFPYHFGTILPLTAVAAGWGYWRLWTSVRAHPLGAPAFVALLAALIAWKSATTDLPDTFRSRMQLRVASWLHPERRQEIRERLYSVADYSARDVRAVADWVTQQTNADASVYVYGFAPELYVASSRRFASRYIYNLPQRVAWSRERARAELMTDLARDRPQVVLVEHRDFMYWVVGRQVDSAADLNTFDALRALLASHFMQTTSLGKFDVYSRVD